MTYERAKDPLFIEAALSIGTSVSVVGRKLKGLLPTSERAKDPPSFAI
jgi:hypothetical protein